MAHFLLASGLFSQSKGAELNSAVWKVSGGLQARPSSGNRAPGPQRVGVTFFAAGVF